MHSSHLFVKHVQASQQWLSVQSHEPKPIQYVSFRDQFLLVPSFFTPFTLTLDQRTMPSTNFLHRGGALLKALFRRSPKYSLPITISTRAEECLNMYRKGGYHPVKPGDLFNNGRYKVVNKLGFGVYSTVWLVFDNE